MREILFRGKDVHTGNWVEGWYEKSCFGRWPLLHSIIPAQDAEEGHLHHVPVYPESVGQYTGLTDKNGKRIFEGDIVFVPCLGKSYEVKFVFGQFFVGINCPVAYERHTCEVIGNIHDNPELLKEG